MKLENVPQFLVLVEVSHIDVDHHMTSSLGYDSIIMIIINLDYRLPVPFLGAIAAILMVLYPVSLL